MILQEGKFFHEPSNFSKESKVLGKTVKKTGFLKYLNGLLFANNMEKQMGLISAILLIEIDVEFPTLHFEKSSCVCCKFSEISSG